MAKVRILEYKIDRGKKVRVKSHHTKKGKLVPNLNFEIHLRTFNSSTYVLPESKKDYTINIK